MVVSLGNGLKITNGTLSLTAHSMVLYLKFDVSLNGSLSMVVYLKSESQEHLGLQTLFFR